MDECSTGNACGPGARCFNQVGGRTCECPRGYEGDPYSLAGCVVRIYVDNTFILYTLM